MSLLIERIDPQTAWHEWKPTEATPWNRRLAAHLYRRACFGATQKEIEVAVSRSPRECVDQLLDLNERTHSTVVKFNHEMDSLAEGLMGADPGYLETWWLYRMLFTPVPLQEKTTLFWHGHFATSAAKVASTPLMFVQNELLRQHALGSFADLVMAISRDPAMLLYLDSTTNSRLHPNENFARELMELFCLGEGNYTEQDIQEVARCFTGWEIRHRKFRFNRYQHDFGNKTVFGEVGDFNGDQAVRIILAQQAAPHFLARKLIRYLVCDQDLPDAYVDSLARELRAKEMEVRPIIRRILLSRIFYSEASIGQKIRSPIELAIGLFRCLQGSIGTQVLAHALRPLGQRVFYPPNVKGWVGGRTWINSTTMIGRVNLVARLIQHETARFAGEPLSKYSLGTTQFEGHDQLVDGLASLILAVPLSHRVRGELIRVAVSHRDQPGRGIQELLCSMAALPEFQLG